MQSRSSPRLPPLRALQAFEAVSRHPTFAAGAEELGVTPSAISHQIQQLEAFLGLALFRRGPGRTSLTQAGRDYADEIAAAFAQIAAATARLAPYQASGPLIIASSPSFAAKWLQPRLPDFLAAHPAIRLRLFTFGNQETLDLEPYDIAIAYGPPPSIQGGKQGRHEPLLLERLRPLCSPALAATLRTPNDLAQATLIHSVNALGWSEYLRRIGHPGLRPANELWLNPSSIAIDAAVAGQGVILESELLTQQELQDGRLVPPFPGDDFSVETSAYFLLRPPLSRHQAQVRHFESWLRPLMASTPPFHASREPPRRKRL